MNIVNRIIKDAVTERCAQEQSENDFGAINHDSCRLLGIRDMWNEFAVESVTATVKDLFSQTKTGFESQDWSKTKMLRGHNFKQYACKFILEIYGDYTDEVMGALIKMVNIFAKAVYGIAEHKGLESLFDDEFYDTERDKHLFFYQNKTEDYNKYYEQDKL